jgi:hypothetical protein
LFRNDESNFFNSPQELMDAFKEIIEERIEPKLLTIFHSKPAAQLEIVEVTSTLPTSLVLFSVHRCMSHLFIFLLFLFAFLLPFRFFTDFFPSTPLRGRPTTTCHPRLQPT